MTPAFSKHLDQFLGLVLFIATCSLMLHAAWRLYMDDRRRAADGSLISSAERLADAQRSRR